MKITPYLSFNGQCREAFRYYEKVLRGKIEAMSTYADSPEAGKTPDEMQDRIIHARMKVGDFTLMGSDAPPQYFSKPQGFSISLNLDDINEGERIFNALADGGQIKMTFQETFWAKRFGMVIDRFGTPWMVNCDKPMAAPAQ